MLSRTLTVFLLATLPRAMAELYINRPDSSTTCAAGAACTVMWLDNGVAPTLESIGPCTVGLYHDTQRLVQTIQPVNVASSLSLTFTPQANAGPNSDKYYIAFSPANYKANTTSGYVGFSSHFALTGMAGAFDSPVASLTSAVPVPSSLNSSPGPIAVSTLSNTISLSVSSATTNPHSTTLSPSSTVSATRPISSAPSISSGLPPQASTSTAAASSAAIGRTPMPNILFMLCLAFTFSLRA